MMISALPARVGSSLAAIGETVNSPPAERTRTPCSRTAARCAPRQISVTSAPDFASSAPRYEPIPPAPITAIRILATIAARRRTDAARLAGDHRARAHTRMGTGVSEQTDPLDPRLPAGRRHRVHRAERREHDVHPSWPADRHR